jgi:nicotinamidase/pyrazinamidase
MFRPLRYGSAVEAFDARSALVVVDVQNDFADPGGSLSVRGGADIVPAVNAAVSRARDAGAVVVYTQDWHPPHTPHFAQDGGTWPVHCVAGTWGADLYPDLDVTEDAPRVRKGSNGEDGYSGFTMRDPVTGDTRSTDLESILRERDVTRVTVCGLATDYCVKATALDAQRLGFATTVLGEAVRAVELQAGDGEQALAELAAAGVTISTLANR